MKTSTTLLAALSLSFAAAGSAFAQEATYELPQAAASSVSRADVLAELKQARADGTLQLTEFDRNQGERFVAQRSRDEVRAETLAAIRSGELQALNRDHNGFDE